MASELQYHGTPATETGLTVVAKVYDEGGVVVGSDVACVEVGALAIYIGDFGTPAAGTYAVRFFSGTTLLGQGSIEWDGTAEITATSLATTLAALNNFDPAADAVANVTLVATTTTNTDMRGTDAGMLASSYTAPLTAAQVNTEVDTALADYDGPTKAELDAGLAGLNNFNPATDTVASVTLVGTTTTNTDMRGTDSAMLASSYTAPLSAAQVNAEVDTALADYDGPTKAELDSGFAALNDFNPATDDVAVVTLVGTTTTNTDMRGTDNALLAAGYTAPLTASGISAAVWDEPLASHTTTLTYGAVTEWASGGGGGGNTAAEIRAAVGLAAANLDTQLGTLSTSAEISALNNFDPAADDVAVVTLVGTTTTNTDMRGTDNAFLASAGLTSQQVRDAMTIAPTLTPVAGSVDLLIGNTFASVWAKP